MGASQLRRPRPRGDGLGQQRMREPDRSAVHRHDPCRDGRGQGRGRVGFGATERFERRLDRNGGQQERRLGGRGEGCDPALDQRAERLGDAEGLARRRCRRRSCKRAGDLERIERVAAGHRFDPHEHEPRERSAVAGEEELMERRQRHRPDMEALAPLRRDAGDQLERPLGRRAAHGEEHAQRPVDQATDRIGEDRGRSVVEPLRIVDREQERRLRGKTPEQACRRDRQRALVRQLAGRRGTQQRDLEGVSLDRGQPREILGSDLGEDVGQAAEGEGTLGFGRG